MNRFHPGGVTIRRIVDGDRNDSSCCSSGNAPRRGGERCLVGEGRAVGSPHRTRAIGSTSRTRQSGAITPRPASIRAIEAPERVGFVALTPDPDIVIAGFKSGLARFHLWGGEIQRSHRRSPDRPGNRINDGHVGPDGSLYFGTMDDEENEPTGTFWRWDGKELLRFREGYRRHQWSGLQPRRARSSTPRTPSERTDLRSRPRRGGPGEPRPFVRFEHGVGTSGRHGGRCRRASLGLPLGRLAHHPASRRMVRSSASFPSRPRR